MPSPAPFVRYTYTRGPSNAHLLISLTTTPTAFFPPIPRSWSTQDVSEATRNKMVTLSASLDALLSQARNALESMKTHGPHGFQDFVYDASQPTDAKSKQLGVFAPGPSDDVKRQPSVKARIAQQDIFDIVREQIPRMKKELELRAKEAADKKLQVEEEARKEVESRNLAAHKEAVAKNAKAIAERAKERAEAMATTEDIRQANVDGEVAAPAATGPVGVVATAKAKAKAPTMTKKPVTDSLKDDAKEAEVSDASGAAEKQTKSATSDEGKKEEK